MQKTSIHVIHYDRSSKNLIFLLSCERLQLQLNQKIFKLLKYLTKNKQQKKPYEADLIAVNIQAWVAPSSHTNMDSEQGQVSSALPSRQSCVCAALKQASGAQRPRSPGMRAAHSAADISAAVYMTLYHEDTFPSMNCAAALELAMTLMRILCVHFAGSFSCSWLHSKDHRVHIVSGLYAYFTQSFWSHPIGLLRWLYSVFEG